MIFAATWHLTVRLTKTFDSRTPKRNFKLLRTIKRVLTKLLKGKHIHPNVIGLIQIRLLTGEQKREHTQPHRPAATDGRAEGLGLPEVCSSASCSSRSPSLLMWRSFITRTQRFCFEAIRMQAVKSRRPWMKVRRRRLSDSGGFSVTDCATSASCLLCNPV